MQRPEGERKLDGHLRVLSSQAGNGIWAMMLPGRVANTSEEGSLEPNGPETEFRISPKK